MSEKKQNKNTEEVEELRQELEKCKEQSVEYLNGWQRSKADYVNLKAQSEKAQKELVQFANLGLILKFLPVYDNFKKACTDLDEKNSWAEGILNIKRQFDEILKSLGVEEIETVGQEFNPEIHEAVLKRKEEGFSPDIVVEELSGGYKLGEKIITAAKVVVSE